MKNTRKTELSKFYCLILMISVFYGCNTQSLPEQGQHYAEISGGEIWYHVVGEGDKPPILLLHGGPGGTCYSLYPLTELSDERTLIIFDQLGTGRSGNMTDTSLMKIDYMVDQLKEFTEAINLKEFYLYGHSWGCMLGLDFYLRYPEGIKGMVLNSPLASSKMWMLDADTLKATLHDTIQQTIEINELNKTYDTHEYREAIGVYTQQFIWRNGIVIHTENDVSRVPGNSEMYMHMWGPSEFNATGNLKNYDRLERLDEINIPTLYITGEFDEARPTTVSYYHSLTPGSEFAIIPNAGHASMHDNKEANLSLIRTFLHNCED